MKEKGNSFPERKLVVSSMKIKKTCNFIRISATTDAKIKTFPNLKTHRPTVYTYPRKRAQKRKNEDRHKR